MKKLLCLFLSVALLVLLGNASAYNSGGFIIQINRIKVVNGEQTNPSPDDEYVKNVVFHFCNSVGNVTFAEVKKYLDENGYSYKESLGSDYSFCKISMDLEEGKISFVFYPLDVSANSTAFGDPNREYLTILQYDRGENWFSIADSLHMTSSSMQAVYRDNGNNSLEFDLISDLVNFYNFNLGGSIALDDSIVADATLAPNNNSHDVDKMESNFKRVAKERIRKYDGTSLNDFALVFDPDTNGVKLMRIYLTWNVENSKERTKKMLEMYSDDLAATIHEAYPDIQIKEMYIFWKVPYLTNQGYPAKYVYSTKGNKTYRNNSLGALYGRD